MSYPFYRHNYSTKEKMCSKCKTLKPRTKEFFYASSKEKDGLHYICKACKKIIDKKSRSNSPRYKAYQKSPEFVFSQLKYQAKKRNIPFELTLEYYLGNLAYKPCHYCGGDTTKHWVDRYLNDHAVGYTIKNSVPSCELCNKMKVTLSPEVFFKQCRRVIQHQNLKSTVL